MESRKLPCELCGSEVAIRSTIKTGDHRGKKACPVCKATHDKKPKARTVLKRIKDKNTRSLPSFSFGLTEIKIKQIQKFKNLVKKFKIKQDFEYIVSTNCIKTIKFLKNYKWIKVHNRSKKLSMDDSLDDLIKILPGICNGNFILWTHVTSPFFDQYEYINFIKNFLRGKFNSAFSADLIQKFIYNHKKKWISHKSNKKKWPRTQDLDPMYVANSGAFIAKRKIYLKEI